MLMLLVALSLAQAQPEVEVINSKDLDKALKYLIIEEAKRLKVNANLPGCPYATGTVWNLECA